MLCERTTVTGPFASDAGTTPRHTSAMVRRPLAEGMAVLDSAWDKPGLTGVGNGVKRRASLVPASHVGAGRRFALLPRLLGRFA
jgi:hypothetical protein